MDGFTDAEVLALSKAMAAHQAAGTRFGAGLAKITDGEKESKALWDLIWQMIAKAKTL